MSHNGWYFPRPMSSRSSVASCAVCSLPASSLDCKGTWGGDSLSPRDKEKDTFGGEREAREAVKSQPRIRRRTRLTR